MHIYESKVYENIEMPQKRVQDVIFSCCTFIGCKFKEAVFDNVTFDECVFKNCAFVNPVFNKSEMKFCAFSDCTLIGINWSILRSNIADIIDKFEGCLLKFNNFVDMNLKKLNFGKSEIISSIFHQCNLSDCNFSDCNLENTSYSVCDLQKSDFRLAQSFNIDITTCKLKGARFSKSNIEGLVRGLGIKID